MSRATNQAVVSRADPPRIRLAVACNDPDNGLFAHRAEQLQVRTWDGQDVEFEALGRAPRFAERPGRIRFLRHWWPIAGSAAWVGNWCWNSYDLTPVIAVLLLQVTRRSDLFDLTCGPGLLFENWRAAPDEFDSALWYASLCPRSVIGAALWGDEVRRLGIKQRLPRTRNQGR